MSDPDPRLAEALAALDGALVEIGPDGPVLLAGSPAPAQRCGGLAAWWRAVTAAVGSVPRRPVTVLLDVGDGRVAHELRPVAGGALAVLDVSGMRRATREAVAARRDAELAKTRFVAAVSHQLRTPLNAILGMSELALGGELPPQERVWVGTVLRNAQSLQHLVYELLDIARLDAGLLTVESVPFEPRALLDRVRAAHAQAAADKGLLLAFEVDDAVPGVLVGDPFRLRQILLGLVDNAVRYTPAGRVLVHAGLAPAPAGRVGLVVTVTDSGPGVPAHLGERVFERFVQGDESLAGSGSGTGLGLALGRELALLLGGSLSLEPGDGGGATFRLRLEMQASSDDTPAAPTPAAPQPAAAPETAPVPAARPAHVLVAEDNPDNRDLLRLVLEREGVVVDLANDGVLAVDCAVRAPYDLVIMDVQMPRMDGFEAARRIRRHETESGWPRAPIVALTAHAVQGFRERCLEAGMDDYVTKPAGSARIADVVRQHADRRPLVVAGTADGELTAELASAVGGDARVVSLPHERAVLGCLASRAVDLLLLDEALPERGGVATAEVVATLPDRPAERVVVVSRDEPAVDADGLETLRRPVPPDGLRALLPGAPAAAPPVIVEVDADLADLVPAFLARRREEASTLRVLLDRGDLAAVARLGHDLKGSGAPYGFPELSRLGRELEAAAKAGDAGRALAVAEELGAYLARVEIRPASG